MEAGAYEWSLMANHATAARAPFGAAGARYHSGQLNSSAYMRKACVAGNSISTSPLFYGLDHDGGGGLPHLSFDLAAFLMVRGDFAWLGYSWMGCDARWDGHGGRTRIEWQFPLELERDYGEPKGWRHGGGYCTNTARGGVRARVHEGRRRQA